MSVNQFLNLAAARHGQEFHAADLSRQLGITQPTVKSWGGALLEGWVVTEAVKAFMALGRKPDLYFWRSHGGLEVDLLIAIAGEEACPQGILVCRTETQRPLPNGHLALPWHAFPPWLRARLAATPQAPAAI